MQAIGFLPLFQENNLYRKKCLGRPLFCWVLAEAVFSSLDEIYVGTNNKDIEFFISKNYSWTNKIKIISFDEKNTKAEALTNFQKENSSENHIFCLLNAFAPFTNAKTIDEAILKIKNDGFDAVRSTVGLENTVFNTFEKEKGVLLENDALFVLKSPINASEATKNAAIEMPVESLFSVSKNNWETQEKALAEKLISEKETKAIKFLVLDVDGVFTDGGVYYDENGELTKRFDIRDGMGLEILREQGVEVVVMTSEDSALVKKRMEKLKIKHIFMFAKDKHSLLENFIRTENISRGEIAYIGDDVNDLANLCSVGWSFCPLNATTNVKPFVDIILSKNSGNGAIREATERILMYNKRFKS